ncbi:acyl-CoA esterase [Agarivorans sp. Toyoura001]|uniref:alpha/beta fold hydrolase n=1 Tax=Agarivorans sp. Toyoura001 TaxID=2283141 RepID=UPI0010E7B1BC|nr:alpha/beta fold hydrolase [Agarivorans sp. Toyoura001]GDY27452.1 acyl-CoA esterase [Agarivorans sp. Toyoura001]
MDLHYKDQGIGYPILLIHGLFGSLSNLGLLAKHLKGLGYRVISVDALNHGLSPRAPKMDYQTQAKAIYTLCNTLNIEECAIVGHSMGGKVAMTTAQLYPTLVSALVAADIAPVAYNHNHQAVFAGLNGFDVSQVTSRSQADGLLTQHIKEPGVRQFLLKSLTKSEQHWHWLFDVPLLAENYTNITGWQTFGAFNKPCLFIKGQNSDYIVNQYQQEVAQQFPKAELKIISDTGHWLHAEKPAIFNRLTEQFLAKHI